MHIASNLMPDSYFFHSVNILKNIINLKNSTNSYIVLKALRESESNNFSRSNQRKFGCKSFRKFILGSLSNQKCICIFIFAKQNHICEKFDKIRSWWKIKIFPTRVRFYWVQSIQKKNFFFCNVVGRSNYLFISFVTAKLEEKWNTHKNRRDVEKIVNTWKNCTMPFFSFFWGKYVYKQFLYIYKLMYAAIYA